METVAIISRIIFGEAILATPPSARIIAGTRSSAITAAAPASSATRACAALMTSMITPPFSISAKPVFSRSSPDPVAPLLSGIKNLLAPPMQGFLLWFVIPSAARNLLFRWGGNSLFYIGYRAFALLRGLNLHHNVLQPHRQTSGCIRPVLVFEENIRYPIAGRALARIQHYLLADARRMQECRCRSKALVAVPE